MTELLLVVSTNIEFHLKNGKFYLYILYLIYKTRVSQDLKTISNWNII